MLMSEFTERTGFEPTYDEYQKIEEAYYDFAGDKNEFCKRFVAEGGEKKFYAARAAYISDLESQLVDNAKAHMAEVEKLQAQIKELTAELDKELEWKPSEGTGTNMDQARYERLASSGRELTDEEARELVAEECGFSPDKVKILHEASSYEVNKYHRLRVSGTFDRRPMYDSTDWNYIRFDCASFMYELVNGELRFYCC